MISWHRSNVAASPPPRGPRAHRLTLVLAALLGVAHPVRAQEPQKPAPTRPPTALQLTPSAAARVATERPAAAQVDLEALKRTRVIDLEGTASSDVRVLDQGAVREVAAGTEEVRLRPNQILTRRLPEEATRIEPEADGETAATANQRWALPYQIVGLDAEGAAFELQPLVEVDGGGMRPQSGGGFLGRIFAAVHDLKRPGESRPLSPPIEILVTAEVDEVQPRRISLDRTNRFTEVTLRAASPSDLVHVRLVPSFDPEGTEIEVPVVRGHLQLTVSPSRIQGLGLETARVQVRATGLPSADGIAVALSSDRGSLEASELTLGATGVATTTIRSVTTGVATVRAEAAGLAPADAKVLFVFPWLFLAAAVLGGVVGSLIRWARTEVAGRRSLWLELLVLGVLVGLVVASAYSIGINLIGFEPATHAGEAVVFVLSALGAFFGIPSRAPKP